MIHSLHRAGVAALFVYGLAAASTPAIAMPTYTVTPASGGSVFGTPNWSERAKVNLNGTKRNVQAGLFRLRLDDGNGTAFDLATFCIEIMQSLRLPNSYTEQTFNPATRNAVNALWSNAFLLVDGDRTAAAFRFALWEITHDTGFDLGAGAMTIKGKAATVALSQSWLGNIGDNTWKPNADVTVTALVSARSQNQLFARLKPEPTQQIPVPATGLLIAGAALFGLVHRFRRRAAR